MKALIIGLGLIGGSLAKQLKKNSDWTVVGFDIDSGVCDDALLSGAVDAIWKEDTFVDADITVLCLSPIRSVEFLRNNAKYLKKGSVVSDVCGVKQSVVQQCEMICYEHQLHFVGGHPMAGKERSGFRNADENLFNRASYILTVTDKTDENALEVAKQFVRALKAAKITVTDPATHDRIIAFTSQIPHVIAGSYVKSPTCLNRKGFSAGSFKDCSRVATVDENLWSELFISNREMLLSELDSLLRSLGDYRDALADGDKEKLKELILKGKLIKEKDLKESEG
ncbi:MAG: prephenate dehydrogenase [Ruminococcaceae bacterium]|nr:prephenate dehydrogenase [Oscillospiraceae bacterium]